MNDEPALIASVIANPEDDTLRLAYADFLQEHGEHERAEFIRLQVESPTLDPGKRCRDIMVSHPAAPHWLGGRKDPLVNSHPHRDVPSSELAIRCFGARVRPASFTFRRGFVERIMCDAETWVRNSERFLKMHPLAEVALTTLPATDRLPFVPLENQSSWDRHALRGDLSGVGFPELQILNEVDKLYRENGGVVRPNAWIRAFLRLRWPKLRIELMPDAVLTLDIETGEDPRAFINLTGRVNSGPVMGWPVGSLLLANVRCDPISPPGSPLRWRVRWEFAQTADMAMFVTGNGEAVYDAADFADVLHRFGRVVVSEE